MTDNQAADAEPTTTSPVRINVPGDSPSQELTSILQQAEEARAANDQARAHDFYTRAIEIDSNHAAAWFGRAATASEPDDAIVSWAYTLALAPKSADAKTALDVRVDERIAHSNTEAIPALLALGRTLAEAGQKPWAYRLFKCVNELDDSHEEALLWRAGLADHPQETIVCLERVLAKDPQNARALAGIEWAREQQDHAASTPPLETDEPGNQLIEEGRKLVQKGDKERAYELFKQATELEEKDELAWVLRGTSTADIDEALICLNRALALNPNNTTASDALAQLRLRKLPETPIVSSESSEASRRPSTPAAENPPRPRRNRVIVLVVLVIIFWAALLLLYVYVRGWEVLLGLVPGR